ncbi:MAG: 3'(2'),5'-bisphosphate nucleotidase CysQ [Pseudomonadota bacterium]
MDDIELLVDAAREAGRIGLQYFKRAPEVWTKGQDSPVSEADLAIDRFLCDHLLSARPDYGWLSEETEDDRARLSKQRVFVVDPIDGTRGFIAETPNWTISIAIVEAGRPIAGVLFGPVLEKLYVAEKGHGTVLNGEPIASLNHSDLALGEYAIPARVANSVQERLKTKMTRAPHIHSLAYRFALVAEGGLSGAIARPSAHDWDLAAADIILTEANAALLTLTGQAPTYNRDTTRHDWLIASGHALQSPLKNEVLGAIESEE